MHIDSRVKLSHASLPVGQLSTGTNVVCFPSDLLTLSEDLLDLFGPDSQQLLHLFYHLTVVSWRSKKYSRGWNIFIQKGTDIKRLPVKKTIRTIICHLSGIMSGNLCQYEWILIFYIHIHIVSTIQCDAILKWVTKILTIDTPMLSRRSKVWGIFCDFKVWFVYCLSLLSEISWYIGLCCNGNGL